MTKIISNPEILKKVSSLNIEAQFAFPEGDSLFRYSGELTTEVSDVFKKYKKRLDRIISDAQEIISAIPPLETNV